MMQGISPGKKVVLLHELGGGIIQEITDKGLLVILDEDGFRREYKSSEVALVQSEDYKINEEEIRSINEDESFSTAKHIVRRGQLTGKRRTIDVWEIDLHIEEITDSHSGWSNTEIVNKQVQEFRSFYNKARSKRVRKLVVIHGVGEGILKYEIRSILNGYDAVEFYDADFREYGKGATAIEIHYT